MQEEKNTLEIDFSAYQTAELYEKVKELLSFQRYIVALLLKPIALLLILWLALGIESIYYGNKIFGIALVVLAFPIAIINGFFAGCSAFIRRIETDLVEILTLTLDLSETILNDLQKLQAFSPTLQLSQIVRSATIKILIPTINNYFEANALFVKKPVFLIINKIITAASEKAAQKIEKEFDEKRIQTTVESLSVWLKDANDKIKETHSQVENFLVSALRATILPLTLMRVLALFITGAVLLTTYFLLR